MPNINAARENILEGSDTERAALTDEIRVHSSVLRAASDRGRVRRLLQQSISLTHVYVLMVLRSEGAMTVTELANALEISVASATGIVSRMEQRALVERSRTKDDRRLVTVSLARGGKAALDQLDGRGSEHFGSTLGRLSLDELRATHLAFRALRRAHEAQIAETAGRGDKT